MPKANADAVNATRQSEFAFLKAEEKLILQVQMRIQELLHVNKITQRELAARLGKSESFISQLMGDEPRNLTLRTIARIMHALGAQSRFEPVGNPRNAERGTGIEPHDERLLTVTRTRASIPARSWDEAEFTIKPKSDADHRISIEDWAKYDRPMNEYALAE